MPEGVTSPAITPAGPGPSEKYQLTAEEQVDESCLAACVMTDAERYTALTEEMAPRRVVDLVNRYFDALFAPVIENGGFITDVKGDSMLAVWTSTSTGPEMRARVCKACLQMGEAVNRFNKMNPLHRLPTRIGVDFGPIALAPVGALNRFEYRAVGDTVNTSSRLEQLNKELGTRLLVSSTLAEGVEDFLFRDLGQFQLRGKRSQTRVFELLADRFLANERQRHLWNAFRSALADFETGRLASATYKFRELGLQYPRDGPSRIYLRRCEEARKRGQTTRHKPSDIPGLKGLRLIKEDWALAGA